MKKLIKNKRKFLYKKCLRYRTNVQYRKRLAVFKFKKRKWINFFSYLKRMAKRRKHFYRVYDTIRYALPRVSGFFHKKYKRILENVQKTRFYYGGLTTKYLKKQINYVNTRKKTTTRFFLFKHTCLLNRLEKRLDVILYRSHFTPSIKKAQQLIRHKHIKLNNFVITDGSILVKPNDMITLNNDIKSLIYDNLKMSNLRPLPPKYLIVNYKTFEIVFTEPLNHNYSISFPSFLPNFYLLMQYLKYM